MNRRVRLIWAPFKLLQKVCIANVPMDFMLNHAIVEVIVAVQHRQMLRQVLWALKLVDENGRTIIWQPVLELFQEK